jgi:formyltetrahydrofolate deformylase
MHNSRPHQERGGDRTDELTEITVVGDDDTGIITEITAFLFKRDINVEELDQAVQDGTFRMTMHVDTSTMVTSRAELRENLGDLGDDLGVDIQVWFPTTSKSQSLAVLVTKESHCLEALLEEWRSGELDADIEVVIGNHSDLEPLAAKYGVPFHNIGDETGVPDEDILLDRLADYDIDLIALARYIRILSPKVVFRYRNRIINVHPSLLPSFPGASAYRQAIEKGVRVAGVTAHYVTTELDQGPIISQRAFNVPSNATEEQLERLGQPLEAEALIEAIELHVNSELAVHRGRTELRNPDETEAQLGVPESVDRLNPDAPVDGHEQYVESRIDEVASADS